MSSLWLLLGCVWLAGLVLSAPLLAALWKDRRNWKRWEEEAGSARPEMRNR
jgi:hypothetical protein